MAGLNRIGDVVAISSVFETEPFGVDEEQPMYLNMAVALATSLDPASLLSALLRIERRNQRVRRTLNESRTLDIDILMIDGVTIDTAGLRVPHPKMHERAFVLAPLAEIAPDVVHTGMRRTVAELAQDVGFQGVTRIGELAGVKL